MTSHPVASTDRQPGLPVISVRQLFPWALFAVLLALQLLYFVGAEQGAAAMTSGDSVHEFLHDGRHLLGFPCH